MDGEIDASDDVYERYEVDFLLKKQDPGKCADEEKQDGRSGMEETTQSQHMPQQRNDDTNRRCRPRENTEQESNFSKSSSILPLIFGTAEGTPYGTHVSTPGDSIDAAHTSSRPMLGASGNERRRQLIEEIEKDTIQGRLRAQAARDKRRAAELEKRERLKKLYIQQRLQRSQNTREQHPTQ